MYEYMCTLLIYRKIITHLIWKKNGHTYPQCRHRCTGTHCSAHLELPASTPHHACTARKVTSQRLEEEAAGLWISHPPILLPLPFPSISICLNFPSIQLRCLLILPSFPTSIHGKRDESPDPNIYSHSLEVVFITQ